MTKVQSTTEATVSVASEYPPGHTSLFKAMGADIFVNYGSRA